ncbi:hypothetical protein C7M84_008398 [Penaeus vannamei]|uniref:Uncharacterized protein n=1 Tax=Penaeus vannamei TaxID=6689 RepID=A0A423T9N1_PENVA|nr:hypothetical protein C7M84_008398 [Penaeus vannamei]
MGGRGRLWRRGKGFGTPRPSPTCAATPADSPPTTTVRDAAGPGARAVLAAESRDLQAPRWRQGISIFQRIPANRTCSAAGIPDHFCTCQDTKEADPGDPALELAASYLRGTINQDLRALPACIRVKTGRVSRSNKQLSPQDTTSDVRSYLLQATLHPGNVAVEATLRYNPQPELFQVTGEVSRINQYGNQSHCIKHSVLRKFCFCKDQLEADHHADRRRRPKGPSGASRYEESRVDETRATTRQMDRTGNNLHTTKPFDDDHHQDGHKQHEGLQTTEGSSEEYRTSGRKDETTKRQGEEATTKEVERTEDKKENSDKGER